jgi:hypothetical protein
MADPNSRLIELTLRLVRRRGLFGRSFGDGLSPGAFDECLLLALSGHRTLTYKCPSSSAATIGATTATDEEGIRTSGCRIVPDDAHSTAGLKVRNCVNGGSRWPPLKKLFGMPF